MRPPLVLALALWVAACASSPDAPVDPVWGKEPCAHCAMLVSAPEYAAELVGEDGARVYFDDVGCMAAYLADHRARAAWVHGPRGAGWMTARAARFARGARTPMDYGYQALPPGQGGIDFTTLEKEVASARAEGGRHDR